MLKKQVYILGGQQTDFQRNWTKEGKGIIAMLKEIVIDTQTALNLDNLEIAALAQEKRVGIFVGNFDAQQYADQGHLGALITEINPSFNGIFGLRYEAACASGSAAIDAALSKIRNDDIDLAIVIGIEIMKTVSSETGGDYLGTASLFDKEAKGTLFPFPKLFGRLSEIILERYRLPETTFLDALSEIANINYTNAKNNPLAQTRSWFMDKNQAKSRGQKFNPNVGGKLCVTDCSQITDGAATIVLASESYTKKYLKQNKIKKIPPRIKGFGYTIAPFTFMKKMQYSKGCKYILPFTRQAVLEAYSSAGLTAKDINVFETHDCFTSSEYITLSAMGLCDPGDEYKIIENGTIRLSGSKPVNPGGGLIGIGHPVGATGVRMMLDLYKQIAGKANGYQVDKVKNGLMLNIGGSATTNIVFIIGV